MTFRFILLGTNNERKDIASWRGTEDHGSSAERNSALVPSYEWRSIVARTVTLFAEWDSARVARP